MELALYHPDRGYYASGRANIGRRGDFCPNDRFDALPVHVIGSGGLANGATVWNDKFVTLEHGLSAGAPSGVKLRCPGARFIFASANVSRSNLQLERLGFFPAGFEAEVNLAAPKLMSEIAAKLSRGIILTIDYGFSRTEFYSLHRSQGSLRVRANQKKLSSPFQQIGLADISAHVESTTLAEVAQSSAATPIVFNDH